MKIDELLIKKVKNSLAIDYSEKELKKIFFFLSHLETEFKKLRKLKLPSRTRIFFNFSQFYNINPILRKDEFNNLKIPLSKDFIKQNSAIGLKIVSLKKV